MAESIQQYWRSVRKIASDFDPEAAALDANEHDPDERRHLEMSQKEIWLISVANERTGGVAGRVVSAHPMIAARYLKEATHVLANEAQIAAHKAELAQRKETIEREEADRKGVPTSKLLEALVAAQTSPGGKPRRAE